MLIPADKKTFHLIKNRDHQGIILLINDIYDRHPEQFGNPDQRAKLANDIVMHLESFTDTLSFFKFLSERLPKAPFVDLEVAYVGAYREKYQDDKVYREADFKPISTLSDAWPVLSLFQHFYNIGIDTTGPFSIHSAAKHVDGKKLDYIITGNVINAPDCDRPESVMLACGNVLKPGGRVIHLLGLGEAESRMRGTPGHTAVYTFARQNILKLIPPSSIYRPHGVVGHGGTLAIIAEQTHEVQHASEKNAIWVSRNAPDVLLDKEVRGDKEYITSSNGLGCTFTEFFAFFCRTPERLEEFHYPLWRDLKAFKGYQSYQWKEAFQQGRIMPPHGLDQYQARLTDTQIAACVQHMAVLQDRLIEAILKERELIHKHLETIPCPQVELCNAVNNVPTAARETTRNL